jgi:hypothetical protein
MATTILHTGSTWSDRANVNFMVWSDDDGARIVAKLYAAGLEFSVSEPRDGTQYIMVHVPVPGQSRLQPTEQECAARERHLRELLAK